MQASLHAREFGRGRSEVVRRAARAIATLVVVAGVGVAEAQDCPTNSPLGLYSPETLTVDFEQTGTLGNRLTWPAVSRDFGGCASLLIPPSLEAELGVRLEGNFLDVFDRRIGVLFPEGGDVASITQPDVRVSVENSHPNTNAQNLSVTLNLSSLGGAFRWNPATQRAEQINVGMPAYLPSTSIRSLATGRTPDGQQIVYAGVTQVPLLKSVDGGPWVETTIGSPPFRSEPEAIVVSSVDPNRLWVRSNREGLWRSDDGGQTWELEIGISRQSNVDYRYFDQIDVIPPGGSTPVPVIFVYAAGLGLYYSVDDGITWELAEGLVVPEPLTGTDGFICESLIPADDVEIFDIEPSKVDPGRVYMALENWGVYEVDVQGGFDEWIPRNSTMVLCRSEEPLIAPLGRERTVTDIVVLEPVEVTPDGGGAPELRDRLVALSDFPPIKVEVTPNSPAIPVTLAFSSADGGETWIARASNYPLAEPGRVDRPVRATEAFTHPLEPNTVVIAVRNNGLWRIDVPEDETVAAWEQITYQPDAEVLNPAVRSVAVLPNGEVILGTINAGTYRLGEPIELDRAIELGTPAGETPVRTGLSLTFENTGTIVANQRFEIIAQAFQGYAVWRSSERDLTTNEPAWELIGLYDQSNPESCSDDPCDAVAIEIEPGCFGDKRANCFGVDPDEGTWTFFDRDVGAGFTYDYAVSTFDYGFTGDETPDGSLRDLLFSPRSPEESSEQSPEAFRELRGGENYNQVLFQVNTEPSANLDEVWAVPNPFVRRAGWDDQVDNFIRFFNVTETARVQIYTIAGDFVRELDNVVFNDRETGLIEWDTRNAEGEQVASGVYIFRVTDATGGEELGRLTLIR